MELTFTPQEIANSVAAAYDSVNIIAQLKALSSLTEQQTAELNRNEQHIRIMLTKNWFSTALTPAQKAELEAI